MNRSLAHSFALLCLSTVGFAAAEGNTLPVPTMDISKVLTPSTTTVTYGTAPVFATPIPQPGSVTHRHRHHRVAKWIPTPAPLAVPTARPVVVMPASSNAALKPAASH